MDRPGIEYVPLYEDDRGSVYCPLDNLDVAIIDNHNKGIKRTYIVRNWSKGLIRAWHGHKMAWTGMHVIKGAAKLVAKPIVELTSTENLVSPVVLSDRKPGIFWVPPGWYNGSMSLEDDTRILVYSTLSFDEVKNDDWRAVLTQNDKVNYFQVVNR